MIPLRDENPARTTPYIVYALLAVNIIAFLYNGPLHQHGNPLAGYALVPAELMGGKDYGPPTPVAPWVTIFTAMFLHANILHIAGNMLYLWIFGNNIEDALGHIKFLIFYLVCGVGAALAQVFVSPASQIPMVGASGAIAGVLAAYLVLFPRARIISLVFIYIIVLPASVVLGFWIVLQVLSSLITVASGGANQGGVAYAAHIGGFATGLILILLLGGRNLLGNQPIIGYRRNPNRW